MNVPARAEEFDPDTGEVKTGLPAGFQSGNQGLAVSIAMAEIDQQITTAHAYPRSVAHAVKNILSLATLDEETAKECVYALPRGGKPIKGPSIRLAEIIQSQWGNNRVGTRVVHVDRNEKYIEAEGVFHDLETNSATTARVRRRISDKRGYLLTDDMIIVTGNAAASIAKRNAILAGVPKAVWRKAYEAVEKVLAGDAKTLAVRREDAMKAFAAFGVTPERVLRALDLSDIEDIKLEHMPTLIGMHSALKSGESSVEEMFPVVKPAGERPADLKGKLETLANGASREADGKANGGGSHPSSDGADEGSEASDEKQQETEKLEQAAAPQNQAGSQGSAEASPPAESAAASPSPEQQSSSSPQSSGGGEISDSEWDKAYGEGREARRQGMSRRACPDAYRQNDDLREAWMTGFDEAPGPGE